MELGKQKNLNSAGLDTTVGQLYNLVELVFYVKAALGELFFFKISPSFVIQ